MRIDPSVKIAYVGGVLSGVLLYAGLRSAKRWRDRWRHRAFRKRATRIRID